MLLVPVLALLLSGGANVDARCAGRDRAEELLRAAEKGQHRRITALIAAGADVNQLARGGSALGAAAYAGDLDSVKALLAAGAKADLRGDGAQDETPLMLALRAPFRHHQLAIVRLLVARGADVNATTSGAEADPGTSPLTEALVVCEPPVVRFLIARGARVVIEGRARCGTPEREAPEELRALLARTKLRRR